MEKRPIHAREGVGHLWLADPTDRTLEAFELRDDQWVLIGSAKDDEPVSIPPLRRDHLQPRRSLALTPHRCTNMNRFLSVVRSMTDKNLFIP